MRYQARYEADHFTVYERDRPFFSTQLSSTCSCCLACLTTAPRCGYYRWIFDAIFPILERLIARRPPMIFPSIFFRLTSIENAPLRLCELRKVLEKASPDSRFATAGHMPYRAESISGPAFPICFTAHERCACKGERMLCAISSDVGGQGYRGREA